MSLADFVRTYLDSPVEVAPPMPDPVTHEGCEGYPWCKQCHPNAGTHDKPIGLAVALPALCLAALLGIGLGGFIPSTIDEPASVRLVVSTAAPEVPR